MDEPFQHLEGEALSGRWRDALGLPAADGLAGGVEDIRELRLREGEHLPELGYLARLKT